jgi:hypothetical protein
VRLKFLLHRAALGQVLPVGTIPSVPRTHLYFHTNLIIRTGGQSLGICDKAMFFGMSGIEQKIISILLASKGLSYPVQVRLYSLKHFLTLN